MSKNKYVVNMKTNLRVDARVRSLLSFVVFMAVTGVACHAQYVGLDVSMPKVDKVIEVTADGVNMRKSPSAAAPKLVRLCYDETDNCCYGWSNDRRERGVVAFAAPASKGDVFMVTSETDEWYGVIAYEDTPVFISKKYAQDAELTPITPEMLTKIDDYGFGKMQSPGVTKGFYRGYACLDIEGYETEGLMFGRIIDGFLVMNFHVYGGMSYDENVDRTYLNMDCKTMSDGSGKSWLYTNCRLKYGNELVQLYKSDPENTDGYAEKVMVMDRLTTPEFEEILKVAGVDMGNTQKRGYIYACADGKIFQLAAYDLENPVYAGRIVTVPAEVE